MCDAEQGKYVGTRPLGAGLPARQPAVQRGHRADGREGRVERRGRRQDDAQFTKYVNKPELAALLPVLYPGVFPNLAAYTKPRADLNAILLTGIPAGRRARVPELHRPDPGGHAAAQRRDPAVGATRTTLGLVAGDPAGFPNGRRVDDDVVTIELRAIAGLTIPLVDPSFTPGRRSQRGQGRHDEHERAAARRRSPTSALRGAATRPCPVPRWRHEHRHVDREPVRRAGLGDARHRRSTSAPSWSTMPAGDGGRRGRDPSGRRGRWDTITTTTTPISRTSRSYVGPSRAGRCLSLVFV